MELSGYFLIWRKMGANRRTFIKKYSSLFAGFNFVNIFFSCKNTDLTSNAPNSSSTDPVVQTINVGSGVDVPANFLGMHFHYWPNNSSGTVSPTPIFGYGTWRSHDYYGNTADGVRWRALNPSSQASINSIYSSAPTVWAELDSLIQTQYAAGRDIYYTIYGTPGWAAKLGFTISGFGPSSPPASQNDLALFIQALITRYNTTSILSSATPIKYLEIWNEPNVRGNSVCSYSNNILTWQFSETNGTNTGLPFANGDEVFFTSTGILPTGINAGTKYFIVGASTSTFSISTTSGGTSILLSGGSGSLSCHYVNTFFWGQSTDIVTMAKTVYQTAKAIDSSINVVSPGFTGSLNPNDNQISSFLNASDGAGGFGKNWIDAIAFHPYDTTINETTIAPQLAAVIEIIRGFATSSGLTATFPLLISEQGWQATSPTALNYFLNDTEINQADKIVRHAMVSAASGMKKHIFYAYDDSYLGTPFLSNSATKQNLLNWFHLNICGKKITSCSILQSGKVKVIVSDGNTHII